MVLVSKPPAPTPPGELRQLIYESLRTFKNRTAMIYGVTGKRLTYQEVYEKAVSVASFLNKSGIGDGSNVAVICNPSMEANIFLTGLWLSGATLCTVNPSSNPEEVRQLLVLCKTKLILCEGKYLTLLESALSGYDGRPRIVTDAAHKSYDDLETVMNLVKDPSEFQMRTYDPEESIPFICFTSGTTGVPKGVIWNSRAAKSVAYKMPMMQDDAFMTTSPVYWISYVAFFINTVVNGGTFIVPGTMHRPGSEDAELIHVLDCIQKYKPYHWFCMPSILLRLCNLPARTSFDLSSLKRVTVAGSHISSSQRQQICEKLFNGRSIAYNSYGATEAGGITCWPEGEAPDHDSPRAASLGKLMPGFTLKVEDVVTGKELGPGQTGEFLVKSDTIMKGYLNQPERYTPDDWHRMGDVGYYDEDGYIYFTGRLKEIMKYRGVQIAPAELEKIIMQHPLVEEVCVVGRPHPIDGERPASFIVRKSSSLTEKEIHDLIEERVADSKKLRGGIFFVETIPKNTIGKTLRRDLVKLFETMTESNGMHL